MHYFSNELFEIFDLIANYGGQSRLVGGCVRDILIGKRPKDIDIATTLLSGDVMKALSVKFQCIPLAIKYGTIIARRGVFYAEITTLRHDIASYGRAADVVFTNDWMEDAKRRDFTFNAIYMDLNGVIDDFFNGINDLKSRAVRFIGDPRERIQEDYLRILRYFRFIAYFGDDNRDNAAINAINALSSGLSVISKERINKELMLILSAPFSRNAIIMMAECKILNYIFHTNIYLTISKNFGYIQDPILNFAALCYSLNFSYDAVLKICDELKFSKQKKQIVLRLYFHLYPYDISDNALHIIYLTYGIDFFIILMKLYKILDLYEFNIDKFHFIADMPISNKEISMICIQKKNIPIIKRELIKIWVNSDGMLSKNDMIQLIEHFQMSDLY